MVYAPRCIKVGISQLLYNHDVGYIPLQNNQSSTNKNTKYKNIKFRQLKSNDLFGSVNNAK
jgi:hypothetical protein